MPKNPKPTPKKPRKKVTRKPAVKAVKAAAYNTGTEKVSAILTHTVEDSPKPVSALPQAPLLVRLPHAISSEKPADSIAAGTSSEVKIPDASPLQTEPSAVTVPGTSSRATPSPEATIADPPKISDSQATDVHSPDATQPTASIPNPEEKPNPQAETTLSSAKSVTPAKRGRSRRRYFMPALTILLIAALVLGGLQYMKSRNANADERLINEISKRVVLPASGKPQVTTVVDENKVNQPFLANSRKGDKVLLYFQESRAVVYRPSTGQVVNMGPLVSPNPRVQLRNGANSDIPLPFRNKLTGSTEYSIASQDVAVKRDYTQTIVIDVAGRRPDVARRLAVLLGAKVAELPDSETRPDADMLVIVGSDAK